MAAQVESVSDNMTELIYDFRPSDPYDSETRLQISLGGILNPLSEFSLCFWFLITRFKPLNSLLSYALSDEDDNTFKIVPASSSLSGTFRGKYFKFIHQLNPLRWYHSCFVVNETFLTIFLNNSTQSFQGRFVPVTFNGSLVIGQEQDSLDGGYTAQQSFRGKFSYLNVWNQSLTAEDVKLLNTCSAIAKVKIIEWNKMHWKIHNNTGTIFADVGNPCMENRLLRYLFFDNKEQWPNVLEFTKRYQLKMTVPRNDEERDYISSLLRHHGNCTSEFTSGAFVWVGIKYRNKQNDFVDINEAELQYDSWHQHLIKKFLASASLSEQQVPIFVMQEAKGDWFVDDNMVNLCFVAERQSEDKLFFIHNLKDFIAVDNDYDLTFVLAPWHEGKSVYFHGLGSYLVRKLGNSQWCLFPYSDFNSSLLCIKEMAPPLGRSEWKIQDNDITIELAFSSCLAEQYTCPGGSCISLRERCNQQMDCKDGADEMNCYTTTLPKGYVHQLPSEAPLSMVVFITIWRIGSIDILNMAVSLDLVIDIQWYDNRLQFRHLHENISRMITRQDEMIWLPEVRVSNSIAETRYSDKDIFVLKKNDEEGEPGEYLSSSGSLIQKEALQVMFHCVFNLTKYPLDNQLCSVNFQITNIGKSGLIFSSESRVESFPPTLSQYIVQDCRLLTQNRSNNFSVTIALSRRPDYMLWTTYLPTLLLLCIGYGTLFLPTDSFPERGGMSLTTMLVLISLYSESSSDLPTTAYLKLIDVWFVFCISYLSLVITIHLMTSNVRSFNQFGKVATKVLPSTKATNVPFPIGCWEPLIQETEFKKRKFCQIDNSKLLLFARVACALVFVVFMILYFNSSNLIS